MALNDSVSAMSLLHERYAWFIKAGSRIATLATFMRGWDKTESDNQLL